MRSIIKRDALWLKYFWVRSVFVFWVICLISAGLSDLPAYSLGEAFIWIRFPLFAMATCFWLGADKRLLYAMFATTMLGMITMCGILTAEILILGQQQGRLSWPYGDFVPGNYLAKVGLPAFSVLVAIAVSSDKKLAFPAALVSLATIAISVVTGERINFIIRAFSGMLAAISWKPKWKRVFWLIIIEIVAVISIFYISPQIGTRFVNTFIEQLPTNVESPYLRVWNGGIDAFQTAPVIGIGPDNYRKMCAEISRSFTDVDCHTHPHNFYIQIAAETGIIGLIAGSIMICSIIWFCVITGLKNRNNVISATAFIVPLGLFFPVQSTADFFGQWNNSFMWSAIALALAARSVVKIEK